jgi:hypothetical protein
MAHSTNVSTHPEDAQRNGRKASKALENEKDKIIREVETNVDAMLDEVDKDM